MAEQPAGLAERLQRWGTAAENGALVALLGAMMLLAVGQIVLRLFFSFGFVWADELIKLMVLWIAMIASVAASRSGRHLKIDILSHFVPEKYARVPRLLVGAFAVFVCGLLAYHSFLYVQVSIEFEDTVLVDVPAWMAYGIMPLSFGLMCYRFLLAFVADARQLIRGGNGTERTA